jgi:hypothetical protein
MPIVQISQLQHRTGLLDELPQLAIGELGFSVDSRQLFIGNDSNLHPELASPNEPNNTEILTRNPNCFLDLSQLTGNVDITNLGFKISGGNDGQVLTTNIDGNLRWSTVSGGGGGAGSAAGNAGEIQFNTSGTFGASAALKFNETNNTLTVGNIVVGSVGASGNVSGNYIKGNGSALVSITGANVTGFVANANVANVAYKVSGANVTGSVALASLANAVAGANVTGYVNNALVANTVQINAQPNITSVGTLVSLTVTGAVSATNFTGSQFTGNFSGNGATLTNLNAANVIGVISNATFATTSGTSAVANLVTGANVSGQVANALVAGTVTTRAQPNITSVGTLSGLTVTGNVSSTYFVGNGTYLTGVFGPAFVAAQTAYQSLQLSDTLSTLDLVYNSLTSHTGNEYNVNTGVFVAPLAGWYSVSASIAVCPYASHNDSGTGAVCIYKNANLVVSGNFTGVYSVTTGGAPVSLADTSTASTSVYLAIGDTLHCKMMYIASGSLWTTQSQGLSIFQAHWVRP